MISNLRQITGTHKNPFIGVDNYLQIVYFSVTHEKSNFLLYFTDSPTIGTLSVLGDSWKYNAGEEFVIICEESIYSVIE